MRFRPRNVRSRLTLWYVLVLASLLALYDDVASLFLFLSLREDFDHNLLIFPCCQGGRIVNLYGRCIAAAFAHLCFWHG
jgi:hypothetical protein